MSQNRRATIRSIAKTGLVSNSSSEYFTGVPDIAEGQGARITLIRLPRGLDDISMRISACEFGRKVAEMAFELSRGGSISDVPFAFFRPTLILGQTT